MKHKNTSHVTKYLVESALNKLGLVMSRRLINGRRVYRVSDGKEFETFAELIEFYHLKLKE